MATVGTSAGSLATATGGITDENGNSLLSTDTAGATAQPLGPTLARVIATGVANGDVSLLPHDPEGPIDDDNPLPLWDLYTEDPDHVRVTVVPDAESASGYVLRFTIAPGALAGTVTVLTRNLPIASSRARSFVHQPRAHFIGSTGASSGNVLAVVSGLYVLRDLSDYTADPYAANSAVLTGLDRELQLDPGDGFAVGSTAGYLEYSVGVEVTGAITTTEWADVIEIRLDAGSVQTLLTDQVAGTSRGGAYINDRTHWLTVADATTDAGAYLSVFTPTTPHGNGVWNAVSAAPTGGRYSGANTSCTSAVRTTLALGTTVGEGLLGTPSANAVNIEPGTYLIVARVSFASSGAGAYRRAWITAGVNDLAVGNVGVAGASLGYHVTAATVCVATATVAIGVDAQHDAGTALNAAVQELSIVRLGDIW